MYYDRFSNILLLFSVIFCIDLYIKFLNQQKILNMTQRFTQIIIDVKWNLIVNVEGK